MFTYKRKVNVRGIFHIEGQFEGVNCISVKLKLSVKLTQALFCRLDQISDWHWPASK